MSGVNAVMLVGRVGKEPEVTYLDSGKAMARFSVATSRYVKSEGQSQEETEWHRVVAFDQPAEYVGNHVGKGRLICVQGRLQTRKWTDKDGAERYWTEVVAERITGLDKAAANDDESIPGERRAAGGAQRR